MYVLHSPILIEHGKRDFLIMVILVVDDELPIREWLKFTIEKCVSEDTTVIYASNGQEACNIMQRQSIDMVFTDIKMPVMDGLELLQSIREGGKNIYVVLLTSYADFDYARTALSMKAEAYILKNEISIKTIEDIFSQFKRSRSRSIEINHNDLQIKRAALFKHIVHGLEVEKSIDEFRKVGIPLEDNRLIMIAIRNPKGNDDAGTPIENLITHDDYLRNTTCFIYNMETCIFVANTSSSVKNDSRDALWESISQKLGQMGSNHFYVGISLVGEGFNCFPELFSQCIQAVNQYFYSSSQVNYYNMQPPNHTMEEELEKEIALLSQRIEHFQIKDLQQNISQLMDSIYRVKPQDTLQIRKRCNDILRDLMKECDKRFNKDCQSNYNYWDDVLMNVETFFEFRSFYERCIQEVMDNGLLGIHNEYIKKAIYYIYQNYKTIESIDDICNAININKEYLCRLFKKETGKTINAYLTHYRLSTAREMLKTSSLTISEIAEQTGYLNTNYFSRLYKSIMGINPKEERLK